MAITYYEKYLSFYGANAAEATEERKAQVLKEIAELGKDPNEIIDYEGNSFMCSICGKPIYNEPDSSAYPVNDGRCCGWCDHKVVLPARLEKAFNNRNNNNKGD